MRNNLFWILKYAPTDLDAEKLAFEARLAGFPSEAEEMAESVILLREAIRKIARDMR